ncbi:MAG TPA: NTPase [Bacteroidetes bacterium]|nr:NTPase [Bacteroidota bacterium]
MKSVNILLTGNPGVGKTTLIQKIIAQINQPAIGFYTVEIRQGRNRVGFEIVTLDGQRGILAHQDFHSSFRVGKYGVNLIDLENIGVVALQKGLQSDSLIVVDEIGKMELFSQKFQKVIWMILDSSNPFLATVTKRPNSVATRIKARKDVQLYEITKSNRNEMVERIVAEICSNKPI